MPEPVQSGRTWGVVPHSEPVRDEHRSELLRLRDVDQPSYTVLFKRPDDDAPPGELYAIGMERIGYLLGEALRLPVAPVFLETFGGNAGAMLETIHNEVSWFWFEKFRLRNEEIVNVIDIPRCVVFDIWIANIDRKKKNLLLQPQPPSLPHGDARRWKLWLIDHGNSGLWPPGKFGLQKDDVVADVDLERFVADVETIIAEEMPGGYRSALTTAGPEDREAALTAVRQIRDDQIAEFVNQVPEPYFSDRERELTIAFLQDRRDRIAALCASVQ